MVDGPATAGQAPKSQRPVDRYLARQGKPSAGGS